MSDRVRSMLEPYVLGQLSDAEQTELSAALAASPELRRELAAVRETIALSLDVGDLRPRPEARAALLRALEGPERRYTFVNDLVKLFDLGAERVRELLRKIDDATAWEAGPLPGIMTMHFAGGPNAFGPDTGFARLPAGLRFPFHRHIGPECNYVIEGALRNGDGTLFLPGEAIVLPAGTVHEFSVPAEADVLIAVAQVGFEIVGQPSEP